MLYVCMVYVRMKRILIYTLNKQQKLPQTYVQYLYWDEPECNIESRMVFHTWKNYGNIHTTISLQGGSCVKVMQVLIQQTCCDYNNTSYLGWLIS